MQRYEEKNDLDHSHCDGLLVSRIARFAAELYRGNGEDEERTVRRKRLPFSLSGQPQLGAERNAALSGKKHQRNRAPCLSCRFGQQRPQWQRAALPPVFCSGQRRHHLLVVRTQDHHHTAGLYSQGHDSALRQELYFRGLEIDAGNCEKPIPLSESATRRGGLHHSLHRIGKA